MNAAASSGDGARILAIVGPTAAGKSDVALQLTEQLNGEIVSVDSMQVYRGMDVGTAKPSASDRVRVPHHLIDVTDITDEFNAARFVRLAQEAIREISGRGRLPILCGGTGLYFKALFHGLGQAPPGDESVRGALEKVSDPELLEELASCDPVTYERIDRHNRRRIVRALEVFRVTGKPYSAQQADWGAQQSLGGNALILGVRRDPAVLRSRIDARVERMFSNGLVYETEQLLKAGLATNRVALQALGYRQVKEYLEGSRSLPETIELAKTRTRQFAKRQMTWFRRQLHVQWIYAGSADSASKTAVEIAKHLPER